MASVNELLPELEELYPGSVDDIDHPFSSTQYKKRVEICQNALNDANLLNKWKKLTGKFKDICPNCDVISTDIELLQGTPSFRYGVEIEDSEEYKTVFYFVISVLQPVFSFYFIDYEKFPKGNIQGRKKLGPLKERFLSFGLMREYEMLSDGLLPSPTELELPADIKLEFLLASPRFEPKIMQERSVVTSFSAEAVKEFPKLELLPKSVAQIKMENLAPKMIRPKVYYTVFDCLFIGDLYY